MEHSLTRHKPQQKRFYTGKFLPFETQFQGLDLKSHTPHYADNQTQQLFVCPLNLEG